MLTASSSCTARTSDPFARKAGYEAVQRMDKQGSAGTKATPQKDASNNTSNNHGSWGPLFQNKQNFASMHWC